MTKLYLITGFLGAGKTTFLKKFVRLFPDKKIALIINEFGKSGMDGALLKELDLALAEIDNGSIFCACRIEQFEDAVRSMLKEQPDFIFVEASGLADPSAVKSIFRKELFGGLEYSGAICIVDAVRFHKVYSTARVCRMQLAISDLVLINKTDMADRDKIDGIKEIVLAQKPSRPVFETEFGAFEREWLDKMDSASGDNEASGAHAKDIALQKRSLVIDGFDLSSLTSFLKMIAEDTYRIKGFVELENKMYAVDCVGPLVEVRVYEGPTSDAGTLTVLYGHGLPAVKSIKEARSWFENASVEILS